MMNLYCENFRCENFRKWGSADIFRKYIQQNYRKGRQ